MFLATINVPGYLPWDDEPPVFEAAWEAWDYLLSEYERACEQAEAEPDEHVASRMRGHAAASVNHGVARCFSEYAATPGYDGDHDLGLVYTVTQVTE